MAASYIQRNGVSIEVGTLLSYPTEKAFIEEWSERITWLPEKEKKAMLSSMYREAKKQGKASGEGAE